MIDNIRQFVVSRDFVFVLLILGFILVITLLSLENRRDNIRIRRLNQKVKDLIAGDYSEVLDMLYDGRCSCDQSSWADYYD